MTPRPASPPRSGRAGVACVFVGEINRFEPGSKSRIGSGGSNSNSNSGSVVEINIFGHGPI